MSDGSDPCQVLGCYNDAQQLLQVNNPSFEAMDSVTQGLWQGSGCTISTLTPPGWAASQSVTMVKAGCAGTPAPDGSNYYMSLPPGASLSQEVATTVGQMHSISFFAANIAKGSAAKLCVSQVGGVAELAHFAITASGFEDYMFNFFSRSSFVQVTFKSCGQDPVYLDAVSVAQTPGLINGGFEFFDAGLATPTSWGISSFGQSVFSVVLLGPEVVEIMPTFSLTQDSSLLFARSKTAPAGTNLQAKANRTVVNKAKQPGLQAV